MKAWKRAARQRADFSPALGGLPLARSSRFSAFKLHAWTGRRSAVACPTCVVQHSGPRPVLLPGAWPLSRGKSRGRAKTHKCVATRRRAQGAAPKSVQDGSCYRGCACAALDVGHMTLVSPLRGSPAPGCPARLNCCFSECTANRTEAMHCTSLPLDFKLGRMAGLKGEQSMRASAAVPAQAVHGDM